MNRIIKSDFKAPYLLANPHVQTCLAILGRYTIRAPIRWEELALPDGDFVDLAWLGTQAEGPIIVLIPGLEGGLHAEYISSLVSPLLEKGWRVVVMHFRCCSGRMNLLPRAYSANDSDDLQLVMTSLRLQNPGEAIVAVGFSLGGSILFKMLSELADLAFPNRYVQAAIGVSIPYDLSKTMDHIPRFYQYYMLRSLKRKLKQKLKAGFDLPLKLSQVAEIRSLREFDEKVTAPVHGFASAEDYYQASSCAQGLSKIKVSSLLIHASDDPLIPFSCVPNETDFGENMQLELSANGGHLGFLSSWLLGSRRQWLTQRILNFMNSTLEALNY